MPLITTITPTPSVDLAHHKTHEGNHYGVCNICNVAVGSFADFLVISPSMNQAVMHLIFSFRVELKSKLEMYENVETISHGTRLKTENYNRISSLIPLGDICMNPTLVAGEPIATKKIFENLGGTLSDGAEIGVIDRNEREYILKGSTSYLFRVTPDSSLLTLVPPVTSIYFVVEFNWYDARPSTVT
jgi:hypothetical protein